jgi:hypothetical protein
LPRVDDTLSQHTVNLQHPQSVSSNPIALRQSQQQPLNKLVYHCHLQRPLHAWAILQA